MDKEKHFGRRHKKVLFKAPYNKRPLKDEQWPCDDHREGDGEDPRFEETDSPSKRVANRKARQLCAQVATALGLAFGELSGDFLLYVESVVPAPDSSQLLITVKQHADTSHNASVEDILAVIHNASGWLRTEVANAISRKRVPQLKFIVK